jgi:hypothetical protein
MVVMAMAHPAAPVKTVHDKVIVQVPVDRPVPYAVPSPYPVTVTNTVTAKPELPEACLTAVKAMQGFGQLVHDSSSISSQYLPIVDKATEHMSQNDLAAVEQDIGKIRDIKSRLGNAQIIQLQALDSLTIALTQCRQEIDK